MNKRSQSSNVVGIKCHAEEEKEEEEGDGKGDYDVKEMSDESKEY